MSPRICKQIFTLFSDWKTNVPKKSQSQWEKNSSNNKRKLNNSKLKTNSDIAHGHALFHAQVSQPVCHIHCFCRRSLDWLFGNANRLYCTMRSSTNNINMRKVNIITAEFLRSTAMACVHNQSKLHHIYPSVQRRYNLKLACIIFVLHCCSAPWSKENPYISSTCSAEASQGVDVKKISKRKTRCQTKNSSMGCSGKWHFALLWVRTLLCPPVATERSMATFLPSRKGQV